MELFFHAFSKLSCNDTIKREYEDVMVEKISASQSKKLVFIYCKRHQFLSYKKIQIMEKELYKQVFRRLGFRPRLQVSYPDLGDMPLVKLLSQIEDDLKAEIRERDLVEGLEFCAEPFEAEGDSLYITCGDSFLTRQRCDGVREFIRSVFLQRFGREITVDFHFKEFERKKDTKPETYFVKLNTGEEKKAAEGAGTVVGQGAEKGRKNASGEGKKEERQSQRQSLSLIHI